MPLMGASATVTRAGARKAWALEARSPQPGRVWDRTRPPARLPHGAAGGAALPVPAAPSLARTASSAPRCSSASTGAPAPAPDPRPGTSCLTGPRTPCRSDDESRALPRECSCDSPRATVLPTIVGHRRPACPGTERPRPVASAPPSMGRPPAPLRADGGACSARRGLPGGSQNRMPVLPGILHR